MLSNIIEDERDKIEDFRQKYEAIKPYLNIDLFMAEQKKSKETTIVSDNFDDLVLKHGYEDKIDIEKPIKTIEEKEGRKRIEKIQEIIEETKEQQQEREAKIKEIIGDNL